MMKNIYTILFVTLLLSACSKEERVMYNLEPRIYFNQFTTNQDSINYSFAVRPATLASDTVWISIRIMGVAADHDRTFNFVPLDSSTAKPGYHYKLGSMVMPANAYETRVPMILYKQPGLKDSLVAAVFEMKESADFSPGYADVQYGKNNRLHYKVTITDKLSKPTNWDGSLAPNFGAYSNVKFKFMIDVTGKSDWTTVIYPGDLNFYIQTVKLELYNYEQAHGPMLDENGVQVVFP